jgi:Zn-dependent protease with chaperone function
MVNPQARDPGGVQRTWGTHRSLVPFVTLGLLLVVALVAAVAAGLEAGGAVTVIALVLGLAVADWLVALVIVRWAIPARDLPHDGVRYLTGEPIGALVERRCRDADIPLVRLGVVDDGVPNAFTFGRTRRSAQVCVTRGCSSGSTKTSSTPSWPTRSVTSATTTSCS